MIGRGSEWRRWEPHIHAPGTVLNNQFGGGTPWETYLTSLESVTPRIEAIAVTDYYLTDTYEEVLRHKAAGRLSDVQLIFPNVELRLDVAAKTGFVNVHLLVSPEDPNHVAELHRILQRLQFQAHGDTFNCTRNDLISLGKKADTSIIDDRAALAHGATQFKVNFDQLRRVMRESDWAKARILIAVAGAAGDGTSGLRQAADATMRQEIEKFAHIIFSSSPAQREFWSGRKGVSLDQLKERYDGCKPCLHGSDAHDQKTVGQPVEERYSWIKGGLEFDALRQACIDPEGRAYVGTEPPRTAMPSQVISHVAIAGADWAATPHIPLNPGLVAIIGARGSGKTALADMIAAGCDAITPAAWSASENISPSFLVRARQLLGDATAALTWGGGASVTRFLDGRDANGHLAFPRARYLSQQFVEELCSSAGVSDGLIAEIERVIFEAHAQDDRDGAIDFAELRDFRTARFQQAREREAEAIADISDRIATEIEKEASAASLALQVTQKTGQIKSYNEDLAKLVVKGTEAQANRHTQLGQAVQTLRGTIQAYSNQRRTFVALQDEVASTRATKAPELLRQAKERHQHSGLNPQQWDEFLLMTHFLRLRFDGHIADEEQGREEGDKDHHAGQQEGLPDADPAGQETARQRPGDIAGEHAGREHAERPSDPVLRRLRGDEHHGARGIAADQPDDDTHQHQLPDILGETGQRHGDAHAEPCADQGQLAPVPIGEPAPERGRQRRHQEGDAESDAGPAHDCDLGGDAELGHVDGQDRHDQRHAGDGGEGAEQADGEVPAPVGIMDRCRHGIAPRGLSKRFLEKFRRDDGISAALRERSVVSS